jgi:hypothetical protein
MTWCIIIRGRVSAFKTKVEKDKEIKVRTGIEYKDGYFVLQSHVTLES